MTELEKRHIEVEDYAGTEKFVDNPLNRKQMCSLIKQLQRNGLM